jgi:hypothetical protein
MYKIVLKEGDVHLFLGRSRTAAQPTWSKLHPRLGTITPVRPVHGIRVGEVSRHSSSARDKEFLPRHTPASLRSRGEW